MPVQTFWSDWRAGLPQFLRLQPSHTYIFDQATRSMMHNWRRKSLVDFSGTWQTYGCFHWMKAKLGCPHFCNEEELHLRLQTGFSSNFSRCWTLHKCPCPCIAASPNSFATPTFPFSRFVAVRMYINSTAGQVQRSTDCFVFRNFLPFFPGPCRGGRCKSLYASLARCFANFQTSI